MTVRAGSRAESGKRGRLPRVGGEEAPVSAQSRRVMKALFGLGS